MVVDMVPPDDSEGSEIDAPSFKISLNSSSVSIGLDAASCNSSTFANISCNRAAVLVSTADVVVDSTADSVV